MSWKWPHPTDGQLRSWQFVLLSCVVCCRQLRMHLMADGLSEFLCMRLPGLTTSTSSVILWMPHSLIYPMKSRQDHDHLIWYSGHLETHKCLAVWWYHKLHATLKYGCNNKRCISGTVGKNTSRAIIGKLALQMVLWWYLIRTFITLCCPHLWVQVCIFSLSCLFNQWLTWRGLSPLSGSVPAKSHRHYRLNTHSVLPKLRHR